MILLDTNVISELMRPMPDRQVVAWFEKHMNVPLYLSSITEAELWAGFHQLPEGKRRSSIGDAITQTLVEDFFGRILFFDSRAARAYGEISGTRKTLGLATDTADIQIAAIAKVNKFKVATRDASGFAGSGVEVISPWEMK